MKRWLILIVVALCVASSVRAQTVWVISTAADSGLTISSPDEYLAGVGTCTRFDSTQVIFNDLVQTLPLAEARDDFVRLTSYGTWQFIFDVEGLLPPDDGLFTNVEVNIPECPRTFLSVDYLLDPRRSDCLKRALLLHEWRHMRDFINGRAAAFMMNQSAPETFAQELELLEFEYRGAREQLSACWTNGCPDEDWIGRAYRQGGLPRLRWAIATNYGILARHPDQKKTIWNACKWLPWEP
jgi:hypothetical protein